MWNDLKPTTEEVNAVKHKSYTPIHRIAALYCTYSHLRKDGRSVLAGLNRHRLQSGSRARHSQGTATATAPALSTCTVRETVLYWMDGQRLRRKSHRKCCHDQIKFMNLSQVVPSRGMVLFPNPLPPCLVPLREEGRAFYRERERERERERDREGPGECHRRPPPRRMPRKFHEGELLLWSLPEAMEVEEEGEAFQVAKFDRGKQKKRMMTT